MHAFMWRPLCENGRYVYQNPPTFEKLRLFPCWQNGTDALTSIRVADTESSKNVEYLLPRNHTERSNSLERRKYAKLCASHTHAQIKNFCLMSHFQVTWIIKEIFIWGHTFFPLLLTAYKWSITCRDNSTTKTTSSFMVWSSDRYFKLCFKGMVKLK